MNAFLDALDFLAAHGPTVALGVTVVLLAGCVAAACCRQPAERRRVGMLTALAAGGYLAFALLPLPRWSLASSESEPAASARSAAALSPASLATPAAVDPEARAAALLAALDRLEAANPASRAPAQAPASVPAPTPDATAQLAALPASPATSPPEAAAAPRTFAALDPSALRWGRLAAGAWLAAAAAMLLRSLVGLVRLRALVRRCCPGPAPLARAAGLPASTRFLVAACAVRPFCAFGRRTVVVVPEALLAPERRGQALAVLRHEAAHVRARDPLAQLLLTALAVPLGLHPLFWWLARDVRFHAELLADDAAAAATGSTSYARELLDLAERAEPALAAAGAVPVFHRPSDFFRRIQMLLQREGRLVPHSSRWRRLAHACGALALVASTAAVLGVPAAAQGRGTRELRDQNAALRSELDALRSELNSLRELLQRQQPATPRTDVLPVTYGELMPDGSFQPRTPPEHTPVQWRFIEETAPTPPPAGWPTPGAQDPVPTPAPTPAPTPNAVPSPGAVPAPPPAPGGGVPILSEIPVLESLFRRGAAPGTVPGATAEPGAPLAEPVTPPPAGRIETLLAPGSASVRTSLNDVLLPPPGATPTFPVARNEPHGERTYTIRKGDTLERIAQRELGAQERAPEIVALNPGLSPLLRVGHRIRLPAGGVPANPNVGEPPRPTSYPSVPGADLAPGAGMPGSTMPAPAPRERGAVATTEAIAELVTRCLDLQAELELAEHEAGETKALSDQGLAPKHEARRAAVKLGALKKKHAVVRALVDGEIAATESELTWLERERGDASPSDRLRLDMQVHRARTRLAALNAAK